MVSKDTKFEWRLGATCLENHADPPEDTLGELSHFELGIRRFCYECNREVSIDIGRDRLKVFLDPDICILLEDRLPQKIENLVNNESIEIEFSESCCIKIKLVPVGSKIAFDFQYFGYLISNNFTLNYQTKIWKIDRNRVLAELKQFVGEVVQMAVDGDYITPQEKQEFLRPIANTVFPSVVSQ